MEARKKFKSRYVKRQIKYRLVKLLKIYLALFILIIIAIFIKNILTKEDKEEQYLNNVYEKLDEETIDDQEELEQIEEEQEDNSIKLEEFAGIEKASSIDSWNLILVNKDNPLPENFEVELTSIGNGHMVDSRIVSSLNEMLEDMKKENLNPVICASYRTYEKQSTLYNNKVKQYTNTGYSKEQAQEMASYWVAIPNTSEHQAALALDIIDSSYQVLDQKQENTKVQQWLSQNSYKYGFILRYPNDKKEITKINYEPWHYRYVGVQNATFMYEKGICFEEFIEMLKMYNLYLNQ